MKVLNSEIAPHESRPATLILHNRENVRIVAFAVAPGQKIPSHVNGGSVTLLVTEGRGIFRGANDEQAELSPGQAVTYDPNEPHAIDGTDTLLRFVAFIISQD